jgi:predicted ferric reductase
VSDQIWWHVARSGGIVAWALLTFSVLWGLALSTKIFGRRPRPKWVLDLHRFAGGAAIVFTAIHVAALVLDSYVDFGPSEVLVPFASAYRPAAVAWGVVALYLLAAVEITSLLKSRLPARAWRTTHYLSFPLFVCATAHGVTAGTDKRTVLLQLGLLTGSVMVGALTALRLFPAQPSRLPVDSQIAARG